jgi:radical SAM superfamily enzyme YgiQ (UPF0313 family)
MPLGIYYLAAQLIKNGEKVDVIDAEAFNLAHEEVVEILKKNNTKIVGISSTTVAFGNARSLAEMLKKELPEAYIVIGGPHMTAMPLQTINTNLFISELSTRQNFLRKNKTM